MYRTAIKWAVIAALMGALFWTGIQWGKSIAREEAADERTRAIAEAVERKEAEMQKALAVQRSRAEKAAKRAERLQADLRETQQRVEAYANSEAGKGACLGPEGLEQWNAL